MPLQVGTLVPNTSENIGVMLCYVRLRGSIKSDTDKESFGTQMKQQMLY